MEGREGGCGVKGQEDGGRKNTSGQTGEWEEREVEGTGEAELGEVMNRQEDEE